jgi:hypothetical protein
VARLERKTVARRFDGLFPAIASFANLHLAWRKAARGSFLQANGLDPSANPGLSAQAGIQEGEGARTPMGSRLRGNDSSVRN